MEIRREPMNINEFFDSLPIYVESALRDHGITDVEVERTMVTKSNDTLLHGLLLKKKGLDICPTYYMEDFYELFGEIGGLELAAREMVRSYIITGNPRFPDLTKELDKLLDKLGFRLLDAERNREFLEEVPHRRMCGDLVMIADVRLGPDEEWRTILTKELLERYDFTEDQIFDKALENAAKYEPPVLTVIEEELNGGAVDLMNERREDFPKDKVYVLSNAGRRLGAGAIFYPGVAEMVAHMIGRYTIIPSSIHEVILIPDSLDIPYEAMQTMLREANDFYVDKKEVLSDRLMRVDEDGAISPVDVEDYIAEKVSEEAWQ